MRNGTARSQPVTESERTVDRDFLLTDEEIERFIIQGYLLRKVDFPADFHERVCRRIDVAFDEAGGNPDNEILEMVTDLASVYDEPHVRGALASLLGTDYTMADHRHCHYTGPGQRGGHWHQDSVNVRHHQIRCLLALYYPQEVTEEMGPTMILPGTHYHNTPSTQMASFMNFRNQLALTVEAGTVAITHYDIWHAWMDNRSDRPRRMLKFLFNRASEPTAPSWNHDDGYRFRPDAFALPFDGQSEAYKHRVMWRSVWDWLLGETPDPSGKRW